LIHTSLTSKATSKETRRITICDRL